MGKRFIKGESDGGKKIIRFCDLLVEEEIRQNASIVFLVVHRPEPQSRALNCE